MSVQIDQNVMFMQILEEVAAKHGLACLLQEKPFNGINGDRMRVRARVRACCV